MKTDNRLTIEKKSTDEISFMKLKKFLKEYYMLVIGVVLISLSVMTVFIPFSKEIFSLQTNISKYSKDLESLKQKEGKLSSLKEHELSSQVNLLEAALPSEKPALYIIDILNASSAEFKLQLGAFEFSPGSLASESGQIESKPISKEGIDSIEVDVEISGFFDDLLTYIDYLENALPLMKAKSIGFSTASKNEDVDATITLDVYFLASPKTIGRTSDPLKDISESQQDAYEKVKRYIRVTSAQPRQTTNTPRDNPFNY